MAEVKQANANKENDDQGNCEVTDSKEMDVENESSDEDIDCAIDDKEFRTKYDNLQKQWLNGKMNKKGLTAEELKEYGEHAYILDFALEDDRVNNKDLVFHPTDSYAYTDYDKEFILPSMSPEKLEAAKKRLCSKIDRNERRIQTLIAEKQQAQEDKEKEQENQDKDKDDKGDEGENVSGWVVPKYSIPIRADIRAFNFAQLAAKQKALTGRLFDVIQMDPPWVLAGKNPTRGVALGYSQLGDDILSSLPVQLLQENGLVFVWVINAKYRLALALLKQWGYTMIGDIGWVKQTVNRRIANGHGFYLQHAKETCLIGLKGDINKIESLNNKQVKGVCSDIIYSERRGQSQKPEEVYQYIERLVPRGFYMEIFARRNNLRNGWFSIGNEL